MSAIADRVSNSGARKTRLSVRCLHFSKRGRRRRFWLHSHKLSTARRLQIEPQGDVAFDSVEEVEEYIAPPGGPAWPGAVCLDVDAVISLSLMQSRLEDFVRDELQLGTESTRVARRSWQESQLVESIASEKFATSVPLIVHSAAVTEDASFRVISLAHACGDETIKSTNDRSNASDSPGSPLRFLLRAGLTRRRSASKVASGPSRGNGWYTEEDLPEGCTVVAELPVCCLMDAEVARQSWAQNSEEGERRALGMRLAATLAMDEVGLEVHEALRLLHPPPTDRDAQACGSLPPKHAMKLRSLVKAAWEPLSWLDAAERARLQMVLNLNVFRVATCDEQLCSSKEYSALSGAGLYAFGAGFNHSCHPNVTRYSIGPWLLFRTCRPVRAGEELCFSYLDPEVLHMTRKLRARNLEFKCSCVRCLGNLPSVAVNMATPLAGAAAKQRIVSILQCMQQHDYAGALKHWVACSVEHVNAHVAPFEDALIRAAAQAALCAWALIAASDFGSDLSVKSTIHELAVRCLCIALRVHHVAYGGGAEMYLRRYQRELSADLPRVWGFPSTGEFAWSCWRSACEELERNARNAELAFAAVDECFVFEAVASEVLKWPPLVAGICGCAPKSTELS